MSSEIPIWVNGRFRWLSGIDKKTTCKDVLEVLLEGEGIDKSELNNYAIMERWRKVERPIDENSKILKIWSHWGSEKKDVRLCLRRIENEVDSGRGSPVGNGHTPSLRRKRNRARGNGKPPWNNSETIHPRRLAELGKFKKKETHEYHPGRLKQSEADDVIDRLNDTCIYDNKLCKYENIYDNMYDIENVNTKKKSGHKSYHCSGTGRLHSTPIQNPENHTKRKCCSKRESKQKVRNSENIEKLMKLILAQGATIQSQLQKLKEREEQIESLEHERHRERLEKNGRNYLLETYLGSLKDAEIPDDIEDKKGTDSGITTEGGSDNVNPVKAESVEGLDVLGSDKDGNIYGNLNQPKSEQSENLNSTLKIHLKTTRSKSESRTHERRSDGSLKRTLSENVLGEVSSEINDDPENNEEENAKEPLEEVVELKKIQSQIEMWEKVFKINKKLEKEEENLVRLHIKIKKCQSENYRFTKSDLKEGLEDTSEPPIVETHDNIDENERVEMQKSLETLRMDLEQNSKEIYENFTKLIEDDELVEKKRSCLTQLMSDLERTNHEHIMLQKMLENAENKSLEQENVTPFCGNSSDYPETQPETKKFYSGDLGLPQVNQDYFNQRTEVKQEIMQPIKPKIVKISFEDQISNNEQTKSTHEKPPAPVPPGALKSILKNKNADKQNNSKVVVEQPQPNENFYQQNDAAVHNSYIQSPYRYPPEHIPSSYPYTMPYPVYNHTSQDPNQSLYVQTTTPKFSEDIKTGYSTRGLISKNSPNVYPHSTIVTTKALVHNDTDSSTSSDTSGLSSMYSSSPTVEESYVEQGYVLDTLV